MAGIDARPRRAKRSSEAVERPSVVVPLTRTNMSTSRGGVDPLIWHLTRENTRESLRVLLTRACDHLAGEGRNASRWYVRARALESCGRLQAYACSCGQGYGRVTWPCHWGRVCPWCSSRRAVILLERIEAALRKFESEGGVYTLGFITLTVPDRQYRTLREAYEALNGGLANLVRHVVWKQAATLARVTSIEIKRSRGGFWHPHAHILVMLSPEWSPARIAEWGLAVLRDWTEVVTPGANLAGQCAMVVERNRLREVVKYSVKVSSLVLDEVGRSRPVSEAAADLAEVVDSLRGCRLVRTAGVLFGLKSADLEVDGVVEEDEQVESPVCVSCGLIGEIGVERVAAGEKPACVPRRWCVRHPTAAGWYVVVLSSDWVSGRDPPWAVDEAIRGRLGGMLAGARSVDSYDE